MSQLVLLGGPPGVGKSSVVQRINAPDITCIDADEVSDPRQDIPRDAAIASVIAATRRAFRQRDIVVLSWVFAKPLLYEPFLESFADSVVQQLYLVCQPATLVKRLGDRDDEALTTYALDKLSLINELPYAKIDTTHMSVSNVVSWVLSAIRQPSSL